MRPWRPDPRAQQQAQQQAHDDVAWPHVIAHLFLETCASLIFKIFGGSKLAESA